jgi:ParB-like chromosome segregation protein Spo0J
VKTGTEWLKNQARKVSEGAELPVSHEIASAVEVEAWLQRHAVRYSPPTAVPMALIDEKRSRANQARRDPIVVESVERFATAMRAGAPFPPIVCYIDGGKLVIIDGNNRQAAARKAGKDLISGIVIAEDTPSELIQLLTVEANAHHGVTPELSWRLQQAFHLCKLGFTDAQAAEAASVSIPQLRSGRAVLEADQRARRMKISYFTDLPNQARQSLGVLKDEAVFFQAAKVSISTSMNAEQIRQMVRDVKALPSEGARIEFIGTVAEQRGIEAATRKALGKAVNRVSSPQMALVSGIGKILKVDEAALVRNIVTVHDRDLVAKRCKLLEDKLLAILVALEQCADMEG